MAAADLQPTLDISAVLGEQRDACIASVEVSSASTRISARHSDRACTRSAARSLSKRSARKAGARGAVVDHAGSAATHRETPRHRAW